jgi:hypothetical protein
MKLWRWGWVLFSAGLLAGAIQASDSGFSSSPVDPTSPPQNGGNGFAAAASAAGFKPLSPNQALDLGQYAPSDPLPDGVGYVSFKALGSFLYESDFEPWTDPFDEPKKRKHPKRAIPPEIQALDGKRIAAVGFMLPFDFKEGSTTHFGLLRNQVGCCFGLAPGLNEWIDVSMGKHPAPAAMDVPLLVVGTLRVKPLLEAGTTMGLYHMEGVSVSPAHLPGLTDKKNP